MSTAHPTDPAHPKGHDMTVSLLCESNAEAALVRNAVTHYRVVLKLRGVDPRNYAPSNEEGAGFGWHDVRRAAGDMSAGSVTHMSARMARALHEALTHKAQHTKDPVARQPVTVLMARIDRLVAAANTPAKVEPDPAVTAALPPVPQPDTCDDGYDWMEQLDTSEWEPLIGRSGVMIGDWPHVCVAYHHDPEHRRYGIAVWSEGSVEVRGYTKADDRNADIDQYLED